MLTLIKIIRFGVMHANTNKSSSQSLPSTKKSLGGPHSWISAYPRRKQENLSSNQQKFLVIFAKNSLREIYANKKEMHYANLCIKQGKLLEIAFKVLEIDGKGKLGLLEKSDHAGSWNYSNHPNPPHTHTITLDSKNFFVGTFVISVFFLLFF